MAYHDQLIEFHKVQKTFGHLIGQIFCSVQKNVQNSNFFNFCIKFCFDQC